MIELKLKIVFTKPYTKIKLNIISHENEFTRYDVTE